MILFQARNETSIKAPPEVVFDLVSDVTRHHELAGSGEVLRVRKRSDGPIGLGTVFEADEDISFGGQRLQFVATSVVVAYDPPHTFSWIPVPPDELGACKRIQWWFRLAPRDGGTDVVHEVEVDLGDEMNAQMKDVYEPVRGTTVASGMEKTLANLKRLAEERVVAAR